MADPNLRRSRAEARAFTVAGLTLAGTAVASVVSPDIEGFLNHWVTLVLGVGVGGWVVWKVGRSLYLTAAIEYEIRRPLPPQYSVVQVTTPEWRGTTKEDSTDA